jgi:hypothetical protein
MFNLETFGDLTFEMTLLPVSEGEYFLEFGIPERGEGLLFDRIKPIGFPLDDTNVQCNHGHHTKQDGRKNPGEIESQLPGE